MYADTFISNMHPVKTLEITETDVIKNIYRKRLKSLENSISSFTINIVLKKNSFKYFKYNYYCHKDGHVWTVGNYTEETGRWAMPCFCAPTSKLVQNMQKVCLYLLT